MIDPRDIGQEEFAQREPLTTRLHGLIRSYPKGVGIVREFIQNADDAGSRVVRFVLDENTYSTDRLPSPSMMRLQGPALVVVNDTVFSERDWSHIRLIGQSGKELDATKTGRFGLGFNSVYNVTDFPAILTGSRLGIFDPHAKTVSGATEAAPGAAWPQIGKLWERCPDLLAPFLPYGLGKGAPALDGTVFRLPLRLPSDAATSEISQEAFSADDFLDIVGRLHGCIAELLLFLKGVQEVELLRRDAEGVVHPLLAARTTNTEAVESARKMVRDHLSLEHAELLNLLGSGKLVSAVAEFEHHIEVVAGGGEREPHRFYVIHGLFVDANGEVDLCAREMMRLKEKAVPLAGAAVRLQPEPNAEYAGRVYCGLPLPLDSPIKGCHINGFFDLQSDRQGPFQDEGAGGAAEVRVRWNRLLIDHCCAAAATRVCLHLSRLAHAQGLPPYTHWPRVSQRESTLTDRLPKAVYSHLKNEKCVLAGGSAEWRLPHEVALPPAHADDDFREALLSDTFALPNPALPTFAEEGFFAANVRLNRVTPAQLRQLLRVSNDPKTSLESAPRPCLRAPQRVRSLLRFCVEDGKIDDLLGVPLAHMADGTLRAFGRDAAHICLAEPEARSIFARHASWFIDPDLQKAAALRNSTAARILTFTPQLVLQNLSAALPKPDDSGCVARVEPGSAAWPSETWLGSVFAYLTLHAAAINLDEATIQKLPLVPDQFGCQHVMGTAGTPLLLPAGGESQRLAKALTAAGVPLVSGSEDFLKAVRAFVAAFEDRAIWRLTPRDLVDTLHAVAPEGEEEIVPSRADAEPILDYLSTPGGIKDLRALPDHVEKLRTVRLFPSQSGRLVSLAGGETHHVPDKYALPAIGAEIGLLDCGPQDRWLPLYQSLGVPRLTRARLLSRVLLPRLSELSRQDVHGLLLWMRKELQALKEEESPEEMADLLRNVGAAVPIECTDGRARPACELYHPEAGFVSALLGSSVGFPDRRVYDERPDLWLELFEAIGMARLPRADDVVAAIDALLEDADAPDDQHKRIADIAEYLNDHWDEFKDVQAAADLLRPASTALTGWLLSDALSCRAWLPVLQAAPRDYPDQLLHRSGARFLKPSDLLARSALDLAGSVKPVCRLGRITRLQLGMGLRSDPALEDGLNHLENVVAAAHLGGVPVQALTPTLLRVYEYLGLVFAGDPQSLEGDPRVAEIRARFRERRCMVDRDFRLWPVSHAFEHSTSRLLGRRAQIRSERPAVERGLVVLGRAAAPQARDYADVFDEIRRDHHSHPVPDAQRQALREAYLAAAELGEDDLFRDSPVLLEGGTLADPSAAVLDDAPWLSERARAANILFVDPAIGTAIARTFGLRLLSSAVYERPVREAASTDPAFVLRCRTLESRVRSPLFRCGVTRLLSASDIAVRQPALQQFLERLGVVPVSRLDTALVWTDTEKVVGGSEGQSDVVLDPHRNALVASEAALEVLDERIATVLANELRIDGHDLGRMAAHLAPLLRAEPEAIERLLTKLHVRAMPAAMEVTAEVNDSEDGLIDSEVPVAEEVESAASDTEIPTDEHLTPNTAEPQDQGDPTGDASGGDGDEEGSPSDSIAGNARRSGSAWPAAGSGSQKDSADPLRHPASGGQARPGLRPITLAPGRNPADSTSVGSSVAPPGPASPRADSDEFRERRGRARTYVEPAQQGESSDAESPERQSHRRRVDQAAVQRALRYERDQGRSPTEMPHANEGYDIESRIPGGQLARYIEVKGVSGAWSDFGVPVSRSQFRKAMNEHASFWLYVVEFALEPDRARVYAIQNPAELVDEYWFDAGWRDFSTERSGSGLNVAPTKGATVLIDGKRRGKVANIHQRGLLLHLDIELEGAARESVVYSPRRVQIVGEGVDA